MAEAVIPALRVSSFARSRAFYLDALGFRVDWEHRHEPGLPLFARLSRGDLALFVTEHEGDARAGALVYLYVPDVDRVHADLCRAGAAPSAPPVDQPWGNRELRAVDPDGNTLCFATVLVRAPAGELRLEVRDDPTLAEIDALEDGLYAHNQKATGHLDGRGLAVFAYDERGVRLGGLAGFTWGKACAIRQLFVEERARGRGLGRRLLEAALAEARARGCLNAFVSTGSFQAPGLYRKLGFREVARIDDLPLGHSEHYFVRPL